MNVPERWTRVAAILRQDPWEFQFFQAVRLLERMMPGHDTVGRFVQPSKEIVRFAAHTSTAFPASQIQELQWDWKRAPLMVVNFMGLTGPQGVLPRYYSEMVLERIRQKDRTVYEFFNLFNHRMISLFYQAWEKYRFTVAYERGETDRVSHLLMDLIGIGTPGLQKRQAVMDESLLFYAGLLGLQVRSSKALDRIIEDYFGVSVEVEQFVGRWYGLAITDQCYFDRIQGYSEQLGVGAVVGDEIWDQQSGIRVVLGPLSLEQYMEFLPGGSAHAPLRAIIRFFAGAELDFEIQLMLKRDEVPPCKLGDTVRSRGEVSPQLGWTSWAKTVPMTRDPSDAILRIG